MKNRANIQHRFLHHPCSSGLLALVAIVLLALLGQHANAVHIITEDLQVQGEIQVDDGRVRNTTTDGGMFIGDSPMLSVGNNVLRDLLMTGSAFVQLPNDWEFNQLTAMGSSFLGAGGAVPSGSSFGVTLLGSSSFWWDNGDPSARASCTTMMGCAYLSTYYSFDISSITLGGSAWLSAYYAGATGSTAFGNGGINASGADAKYSFVVGSGTVSNASFANALGESTIASSMGSTALGSFNDPAPGQSGNARVSTDELLVIGNGTGFNARSNAVTVLKNGHTSIEHEDYVVGGPNPTVLDVLGGVAIDGPVTVNGDPLLTQTSASGQFIPVGGNGAGSNAFDFGSGSTATGANSVAFGLGTHATGSGSTVFGRFNTASGEGATVGGVNNTATQKGATAFGDNNDATGFAATAIGNGTTASGFASLAGGIGSQATATRTFAFGNNCEATATGAVAFGRTKVHSYYGFSVGRDNENLNRNGVAPSSSSSTLNPIFDVGTGLSTSAPESGLVVFNSGETVLEHNDFDPAGAPETQPVALTVNGGMNVTGPFTGNVTLEFNIPHMGDLDPGEFGN